MRKYFGFALPAVTILSTAAIFLLMATLQTTVSVLRYDTENHYRKLAESAADAGIAYAEACMRSNGYNITWSSILSPGALEQTEDCNGGSSYNHVTIHGSSSDKARMSFSVVSGTYFSGRHVVSLISEGRVDVYADDGTTILKTYYETTRRSINWNSTHALAKTVSGRHITCSMQIVDVWCWGNNHNGYLVGDSSKSWSESFEPVRVVKQSGLMEGKVYRDITSGHSFACALMDDGTVYCWGEDDKNELGGDPNVDQPSGDPVYVNILGNKKAKKIAAWGYGACVILDEPTDPVLNNKVACWGSTTDGADGVDNFSPPPAYVEPLARAPSLISSWPTAGGGWWIGVEYLPSSYQAYDLSHSSEGSKSMCMLDINRDIWCWGANEYGELGVRNTSASDNMNIPAKVMDGAGSDLQGGIVQSVFRDGVYHSSHICALVTDDMAGTNGRAVCWGDNEHGQVGNGLGAGGVSGPSWVVRYPTEVGGALSGKDVAYVDTGSRHSCALTKDSEVYCWGQNYFGQVGNGNVGTTTANVAVNSPSFVLDNVSGIPVKRLQVSRNHACVFGNGEAWCWGQGNYGQLGNGEDCRGDVPWPFCPDHDEPNPVRGYYYNPDLEDVIN